MTTTFVPQCNSIRDGLSVLGGSFASSHFSELSQIGRLLPFVRQRQVLAMFGTKDNPFSCLRDALACLLRQVRCTASAIARVGQSASNKPHVLNPEHFRFRPCACWYFFQYRNVRFQANSLKLTKPIQLMRAVVGRFAQMGAQALRQALCLANVTKLTRTWVKQAINRTHLGATI